MSSVNKAIILGNVGQDPEVRHTKNGTSVCNFSIATNKSWKTQDGQKQDKTSWHRVTAWGKVAEIAGIKDLTVPKVTVQPLLLTAYLLRQQMFLIKRMPTEIKL